MKKLVLVLAALAVIGTAVAPALVSPAQAADKKLWQGWIEELKKAAGGSAPMADKKK